MRTAFAALIPAVLGALLAFSGTPGAPDSAAVELSTATGGTAAERHAAPDSSPVSDARPEVPPPDSTQVNEFRPEVPPADSAEESEDRPQVPPPPFSEGIFPCSDCHAGMEVNRARRELTDMHTDIELKHDEQHRWCLDCHDAAQRDSLHLASGERIPFDESYRLCGQCHGEKLRDWRAGVHGKRTGQWNGHKQYLLCAHCHNPHQPRFKPLAPKPPPEAPKRPEN